MMILFLIFWVSVGLVFHSYVLYPAILSWLAKGKSLAKGDRTFQPRIIILMSVYNSEGVILEKIESVMSCDYPQDRLHFYIGSDASTDSTNALLKEAAVKYPSLRIHLFAERMGKVRIINQLYENAVIDFDMKHTIMISTDATAIFDKDCVQRLVMHFNDPLISMVGANIINRNTRSDGISAQEKAYYDRELLMKYEEGLIWGNAIGVFGACYAIRPRDFTLVPSHFLVDDFFITMKVLEKKKKVLYDPDAKVFMNLANESYTEYKRKVRIAAGNFQNLTRFWPVLFRFNSLSFSFLSHKVLRWFGPFFLLASLGSNFGLYNQHWIYQWIMAGQLLFLVSPIVNFIFEKINFHQRHIKFIAHFYLMNLGILVGFLRFLGGIKSSAWEPTKR